MKADHFQRGQAGSALLGADPCCDLLAVFGEVAVDLVERKLLKNRGRRFAFEKECEGLAYEKLRIDVGYADLDAKVFRHLDPVTRLDALRLDELHSEDPGLHTNDRDVLHGCRATRLLPAGNEMA